MAPDLLGGKLTKATIAGGLVALALLHQSPAYAYYFTGNHLLEDCGDHELNVRYIMGVVDGFEVISHTRDVNLIYVPPGVRGREFSETACRHLRDSPAKFDEVATALIAEALLPIYSCNQPLSHSVVTAFSPSRRLDVAGIQIIRQAGLDCVRPGRRQWRWLKKFFI